MVETVPHVVWVDNYCKWLRVQVPTAATQMWRDTRWTVHGLFISDEHRGTDRTAFHLQPGEQCYPDDIFATRDDVEGLIRDAADRVLVAGVPTFYPHSISKDVQRIPLALPVESPEDKYNFVPVAVHKHDISSNKGLAHTLLAVAERYPPGGAPIIMMTDINIWKRQMKVRTP